MVILFYYVFFVGISCVKTDTEADGYSGNVKTLFEDLTEFKDEVTIARTMMNKFENDPWDKKYAIALINLYSQSGKFHSTLNAEMKNGHPAITDIWRRASDLINKAVDILDPKLFEQVYRGCQSLDDLPVLGTEYNFYHIITASMSKETAVSFIECSDKYFFRINKAYGAPVNRFSHSQEIEVIMKSTHTFNVIDGPHKDGQYDIYVLSGQASESVIDGNSAMSTTYSSSSFLILSLIFAFFKYFHI